MKKFLKFIKNTILTIVIACAVILLLPSVVDVIGGMVWDDSSDDRPDYTQSSSQSKDTASSSQKETEDVVDTSVGTTSAPTGTQEPAATTSAPTGTQKPAENVHLYLDAMSQGSCRQFVGRVVVTVIFVGDGESSWSASALSEAKKSLATQESELESAAGSHGVQLDIVYDYLTASVSGAIPLDPDDDKWMEQAAQSAGISSLSGAVSMLRSKHKTNEVPIVYAVNKNGRSFAQQRGGDRLESSCVFNSDMTSFSHELLHLFGAKDFYYPSAITTLCETHLGDSVMNGGKKVDDLTAYIVGWTKSKSAGAQKFLDGSAYYTADMLDAEREKENYTGYGTKTNKNGTYTGYMVFGTPHGQGKFEYTNGTAYEGNFVAGIYDGQGVYTFADGTVYKGSFVCGKFEGQGRMTYADGGVYDGAWSGGNRHGQGKLTYADGASYEGAWSEGKQHGQGKLTYANGTVYVGSFVSDAIEGQGKMTYSTGGWYEGSWKAGTQHGQGTYKYSDGAIYVGAWSGGNRHGQGKLTYADGSTYVGAWVDGKKHGQGKATLAGGASYEGSYVSGVMEGQGKYVFASGTVYVGSFVAGKFEGQGKASYTDGSSYEGAWSDGNRHGQGKYTYANGASYVGAWENGSQHGQGTYTYADGSTKTGLWERGKYVG